MCPLSSVITLSCVRARQLKALLTAECAGGVVAVCVEWMAAVHAPATRGSRDWRTVND